MAKSLNLDDLDTWVPFEKKACATCWAACCTLPVEVGAQDLVRLGLITEDEALYRLEEVEQRLWKRRLIQSFDPREQIFTLAQVSGRDCIYLDFETRRCTVYDKRPDTCRNFPKIGPKPGYCPYSLRHTAVK